VRRQELRSGCQGDAVDSIDLLYRRQIEHALVGANDVRDRFDDRSRPSTPRHPSQNADDIGARFGEPSSLQVLINTTGVPT